MMLLPMSSTARRLAATAILLGSALISLPVLATDYPLPPAGSKLIGKNQYHVVEDDGGSLEAIAKKYSVGFLALLQANPGVDPYVPRAGNVLTIPTEMLLPDGPREGIVLNLAELRLYYYPAGKSVVTVYPVGIGQLGGDTLTPTMVTRVSDKRANPTWTPTPNIRARYLAQGIKLPAVVPAGDNNPMGHHAIRLAAHGGVYLLHGTNADFGIGMRVSSGCIRLRDGDIKALFEHIPVGTPVRIINQPIKVSAEADGRRLVEVHQPLSDSIHDDPKRLPIPLSDAMTRFRDGQQTDSNLMTQAIEFRSGMPVEVQAQRPGA